jgi:hypothetical protein
MELTNYKEMLRDNLISLKDGLEVLGDLNLINKVNVCIDYLFYLEDTSLPTTEGNDHAKLGGEHARD